MKKLHIVGRAMPLLLLSFILSCTPQLSEHTGKLDIRLFTGDSLNQPLIVGFGGSEGGNAWASDHWESERKKFIENGFAFMAIGYFGSKDTPAKLDRISLNAIRDSIISIARRHPTIDPSNITLIGGSKGGELVLNLASHFDDFTTVIALVPSHVNFPAHTLMANTSSWTLDDTELPYVPATLEALPATLAHDLHEAFSLMLSDKEAEQKALIPVENISASILLMSATNDEMWPSTAMCNQIIARLDSIGFAHPYRHLAIEGDHSSPLDHFDAIHLFLSETRAMSIKFQNDMD